MCIRDSGNAVAARVVDQNFGGIKPHRLHVEDRRGKNGRMVTLEIRRLVSEQRETGGVRFGKTVIGETFEHMKELLGGGAIDAVLDHAFDELRVLSLIHISSMSTLASI